MEELSKYIARFGKANIAVCGDVMLDKYIWGRATRISQEAPVPVVQVNRENCVLGGAANVARNVLSLGGHTELFGVHGQDYDGKLLKQMVEAAGAAGEGVLSVKGRLTTVKTRVLAGNQQVVRIDHESLTPISAAARKKILAMVEEACRSNRIQALVLEDYAKGIFDRSFMQKLTDAALAAGKIVALDPHPKGFYPIQNLTLMTPNRLEAFELAGVPYTSGGGKPLEDPALLKVAAILQKKWNVKYLLITLGADGMALFTGNEAPVHIPTEARQVFDVCGAGDTVMATMVLSMVAGAAPVAAARIANCAAGIVVGRVGTSAIEAEVLLKKLRSRE